MNGYEWIAKVVIGLMVGSLIASIIPFAFPRVIGWLMNRITKGIEEGMNPKEK